MQLLVTYILTFLLLLRLIPEWKEIIKVRKLHTASLDFFLLRRRQKKLTSVFKKTLMNGVSSSSTETTLELPNLLPDSSFMAGKKGAQDTKL